MKTLEFVKPHYHRQALDLMLRYAEIYPVIALNGPRQSGKTTLAKKAFPHLPYVSLEDIFLQQQVRLDPRRFLEKYKEGAIFDEVQHVPELVSYLQGVVDASEVNGRFIITGSQNFVISQTVTQSLAGRVGQITLLPLSYEELATPLKPLEFIVSGAYPRLHKEGMLLYEFFKSYISSYIERDVRQIKQIEDLLLFQKFMQLCAGRVGQLLNLNSLARDCGIAQTTAQKWLTVLEASYVIFLLRPYHTNFSSRLVKSPKLYFYDTGIAASLLNIVSADQLDVHFARGNLFENLIILEVLKKRFNTGKWPDLYFWRDASDREINLIDEWGGITTAIEIKSGHTFNLADLKWLTFFCSRKPDCSAWIVYGAPQQGAAGDVMLASLETVGKIVE